jgi:hypothetical protein
MLYTPDTQDRCMDWVRAGGWSCWRYDEDDGFPDGTWHMDTLEGGHDASPGDYIIQGVKGEFYPCKPEIFALTYDVVGDLGAKHGS